MINTQPSAAASTNAKEIPAEERNHLTRMIDIAITEAEQEYRMNGILMEHLRHFSPCETTILDKLFFSSLDETGTSFTVPTPPYPVSVSIP